MEPAWPSIADILIYGSVLMALKSPATMQSGAILEVRSEGLDPYALVVGKRVADVIPRFLEERDSGRSGRPGCDLEHA